MKNIIKKENLIKNKNIVLIIFVLIVLLLAYFVFYVCLISNKKIDKPLKITLNDNLTAELNEEKTILDFVKNIQNGTILSYNKTINTSKLGKNMVIIPINYLTVIYNYVFYIDVVDTEKPLITSNDEIEILVGSQIDLTKIPEVSDNSGEEINVSIEGDYDINSVGSYNLTFVATDSSGNTDKKDFILKVNSDPNNRTLITSKGYTLNIINGIAYVDGILIANKSYSLPSNYGGGLTTDTFNAFNSMKQAAQQEGVNIFIISGYRSYADQSYIYNSYVARDGLEQADRYSARPGHSEHQSGFAFDLNSIEWAFENTEEARWINNNCYKYGFILRYPKEKESITGYMYEPWHLRYVGTELSNKLYNNGNWITLEEYFGIDSKY